VILVRAIDLRGQPRQAMPGPGDVTDPGNFIYADWICNMCRINEHDSCAGEIRVCFCPVCWGNEDDNLVEDVALDGNLTSTPPLW
jgi:hypothetical protein